MLGLYGSIATPFGSGGSERQAGFSRHVLARERDAAGPIHSFVEYAHSHRTTLPDNSAVAVIMALTQAYPCSSTNRPPRPHTRK